MVAVNIDKLFFHDAGEPSEYTAIANCEKVADSDTEIAYLATDIPPESLAWLEGHMRQVLCVRDDEGGKVFGVITRMSQTIHVRGGVDAQITFSKVTYSESV